MKRIIAVLGVVIVLVLIVFTLFSNRADMAKKAKLKPISSYPVAVATVTQQKLDQQLSQVGLIVANNDVAVVSELQGKATAIYVKEGSYITAGSPIVKLDDVVQQAKLASSQSSFEKAKKDWQRSQDLQQQGIISDSQMEAARATYQAAESDYVSNQRQLQNSMITAPISGVVSSRPVNLGTMVTNGMVVANIVDNSLFKIKLNIGEKDAFKLRVGDSVQIGTDVYPGIKFSGSVDSISIKGDDSHTYPVQIVIRNNSQYPLKSGMFGTVNFTFANQSALIIPRDALVGSVKAPQVFVVQDGKALLRDIVTGSETGTNIVVQQGLNAGDVVVISGQDNLTDGMTVKVAQ